MLRQQNRAILVEIIEAPLSRHFADRPCKISVGKILDYAYSFVLKESKHGLPWTNYLLSDVQLVPLQEYLEFNGKKYQTTILSTPVVWSESDEILNATEKQRVSLAAALLKNGLHSHETQIYQLTKTHKVFVSNTFRLVKNGPIQMDNSNMFGFNISTHLVKIPNEDLANAQL